MPTPPEIYSVSRGERRRDFVAEVCDWWFVDQPKKPSMITCDADHHAIGLKPIKKGKAAKRDMTGGLQMEPRFRGG